MGKLEVSEVSEFSILSLILKSKLGKLGNFFKTSKFEWIFFNREKLGSTKISEFLILALTMKSKNQKTWRFSKSSNKTNPLKFMSWKDFQVFQGFDFSLGAKTENHENFLLPQIKHLNNCSHFDIKVRAKQTGFINENKMVKYKLCKSCNPQFNLLSPNVALKQHSNFLALTPTVAYEQWNPFVYLKSVKNFPSVEYSRLKFSCEKKNYRCFKISFQKFITWWQMSSQVCLLFSLLIFMIYEKCVFYEEIIQESEFIN